MVEPADGRNERILPDAVQTLAERLRGAGYTTIGGTHNPNLDPVYGMDQGFDAYIPTAGRIRETRPRGAELVDALLAEVDATHRPGTPLYLQATLVDAHTPREPTAAELAVAPSEGVPDQVHSYRATLHRLDTAIARLDAGLRERGFADDNTLFVFIADHGEALSWPAHHGQGHGFHLARSVTSVPWIVRGPSVPVGRRVPGLASQVDLTPTLLGLLGLPTDDLPGHDLSKSIRGQLKSTTRKRAHSDTWFYGVNRSAVVTHNTHCQAAFGPESDDFTTGCWLRRSDPDLEGESRESLPALSQISRWRLEQQFSAARYTPQAADVPTPLSDLLEALGYAE
jgi:arylsulfatase A-like enzyme